MTSDQRKMVRLAERQGWEVLGQGGGATVVLRHLASGQRTTLPSRLTGPHTKASVLGRLRHRGADRSRARR